MPNLPEYRVRARNCSTDSENTIHADDAARQFGFQGGLVPGIVVFGYAIKPLIDLYGLDWLERGAVQIKLQQPVYEGDHLVVRSHKNSESSAIEIAASAERESQVLCASATAGLEPGDLDRLPPRLENFPEVPLPATNERPMASRVALAAGTVLGTMHKKLDASQSRVFAALDETDRLFIGPHAMAHPAVLLELANQALMQNVRLGPWLHAASKVTNYSSAHDGDPVQVRSRVADCYERKGHEFVVLDLVILSAANHVIQHVIHTAIFRPKFVTTA